MKRHLLFLTGHLANKSLERVLASIVSANFSYEIRDIGIQVAGLMTSKLIERRLDNLVAVDEIIVPGLCRGDLAELAIRLGVPVTRGTVDLKDLPAFLGGTAKPIVLDRYHTKIFAEIVDTPDLSVGEILDRACAYRTAGADIIDLGFLPETPFPHLEEAVSTLKAEHFLVSVDTMDIQELRRADQAGADYLLSFSEETVTRLDEFSATPILVPNHEKNLDSLCRAIEICEKKGRSYIADSILDPIHFGFTDSLIRYQTMRKRYPKSAIMMGIGNLTELTEADTVGINALLFGIISELRIDYVLATQVSLHARSALREADLARRIMHLAHEEGSIPKGYSTGLTALHERHPFPMSEAEISEVADMVRDPSYRIYVTEGMLHVFNRDVHSCDRDPFVIYQQCQSLHQDAAHAFYMGVELARAEIACQLGKTYRQDNPLNWGAAAVQNIAKQHVDLLKEHKKRKKITTKTTKKRQ